MFDKYNKFIDSKIENNVLKSVLKYDIFVLIGSVLPFIIMLIPQIDIDPTIKSGISLIIGIVFKILVTNFDKDGDGNLDSDDIKSEDIK